MVQAVQRSRTTRAPGALVGSADVPSDPAASDETEASPSLLEYFKRFVREHEGQLSETELAKKLGISRKALWERRQRLNLPRIKPS